MRGKAEAFVINDHTYVLLKKGLSRAKLISGYFIKWAKENDFTTSHKTDDTQNSASIARLADTLSQEEFSKQVNQQHLLFKDTGANPDHAEWTHNFQWLAIVEAYKQGKLQLNHHPLHLYKIAAEGYQYCSINLHDDDLSSSHLTSKKEPSFKKKFWVSKIIYLFNILEPNDKISPWLFIVDNIYSHSPNDHFSDEDFTGYRRAHNLHEDLRQSADLPFLAELLTRRHKKRRFQTVYTRICEVYQNKEDTRTWKELINYLQVNSISPKTLKAKYLQIPLAPIKVSTGDFSSECPGIERKFSDLHRLLYGLRAHTQTIKDNVLASKQQQFIFFPNRTAQACSILLQDCISMISKIFPNDDSEKVSISIGYEELYFMAKAVIELLKTTTIDNKPALEVIASYEDTSSNKNTRNPQTLENLIRLLTQRLSTLDTLLPYYQLKDNSCVNQNRPPNPAMKSLSPGRKSSSC